MLFAILIFPNITLHFAGKKNFLSFLEILIDEFGSCAPRRAAEKVRFVTVERPVDGNSEICDRNAVSSFAHFGVSGKAAFNNNIVHILFFLSARIADSAAWIFLLADGLRITDKRLNIHREQIFISPKDIILAKEFHVFTRAFLFEFRADSSRALVDNVRRARLETVFGLDGILDIEDSDGSGNVFHSFFPFCAYSGGAALF
jgi:hypothetical protein